LETTSRALLFIAALLLQSLGVSALERTNPFLALPGNIPPSLLTKIESAAVFHAKTKRVRYLPGVRGMTKTNFLNRLSLENSREPTTQFIYLTKASANHNASETEWRCDCEALGRHEFLLSEVPVSSADGRYISMNDESYKAINEVSNYPFNTPELTAVALSELVYVYNADVISIYLGDRNHQLTLHRGFMNSDDYPGYRDSQYIVTTSPTHLYIAVRGTSGAQDAEITMNAEPTAFMSLGLAHRGYLDAARHIYEDIKPIISTSKLPIILTGHSMGGSVALLISLMLTADGISATNYNFSPVPPVDANIAAHFDGLLTINNYFLPTDELNELESRSHWLRLPGTRLFLPDVGHTAGRAHYVINYLKSMLVLNGYSKSTFETALPDCVVTKYPCFSETPVGLINHCALTNDACFHPNIDFLIGYPVTSSIDQLPAPKHTSIDALIATNTRRLILARSDGFERAVLTLRLAYLHLVNGDFQRSGNLVASQSFDSDEGFVGFLKKRLNREQ